MSDERRSFPPAPTRANALVLRAHPSPHSFNHALADAWSDGAESSGLPVRSIDVSTLDFDPRLGPNYGKGQALEPDLEDVKQAIAEAAHIVVAFPVWWSSTPVTLKGLFDRVLLPGWAFSYVDHRPQPGLSGRSARVITTMDAPVWYDTLFNGAAARRQVRTGTLAFCGLKPVAMSAFGNIGTSTAPQRERMLATTRRAGESDARLVLRRLPTIAALQAA